ncbi:MAG: FecR domain-containing protein [Massilibacteroides sp.]|nr:FecR domain-containing protein [Massilibacteroides sp.]MDD3061736.1 FecR domain-containing protein [Massilibacteroides sp.]MDD4114679.1 FecR domain-containing protein [Massilibacteroides sp.]MDD4660619.1 FecR domain-containing protein [Massilibacteroides sp.]
MLKNDFYLELLFKYFTKELTSVEENILLNWLKENDGNKKILSEMTDWWAITHIPIFKSDMEANFREHFSALLNTPENLVSPKRFKINPMWINISAVVLLLITLSISFFWLGKALSNQQKSEYTEISTVYGTQSKVVLPDKSTVILNAGSFLRYNNNFNKTRRKVQLIGEAYFEVTPDSNKPFEVSSDNLKVCVHGTSFNVKAYKNESTIDVALVSGKVSVQFTEQKKANIFLLPNESLSYDKKSKSTRISLVNASNTILWTKGVLLFSEKNFQDIVKDLERKYAVNIKILSEELLKEKFSGSFSSHSSLDEILREIDVDDKYIWSYENGELIIKDK